MCSGGLHFAHGAVVFRDRSHLDVVARKLVPQLQTCFQRIDKVSIGRVYASVDSNDEEFLRLTLNGDAAFHNQTPVCPGESKAHDAAAQ